MEGYPFEIPIEVRFRDLDAYGHVNNAVFVTYLEQGRVAFYRDVFQVSEATGFEFIMARVEVDYRRPLFLNDKPRLGLRVESIGKTSFVFGYQVVVGADVVASARTVQVFFDYQRGVKVPVPEAFREQVGPYTVAAHD